MMHVHEKLAEIQKKLNVPKGQLNKVFNYKYRSCEDILEAVKGFMDDFTLVISDQMISLIDDYEIEEKNNKGEIKITKGSQRIYVKATARISDKDGNYIEASAFAREALSKKGMDEAQITGAASSYARKYALNGLFCIDDTKDADADDNSSKSSTVKQPISEKDSLLDDIRLVYSKSTHTAELKKTIYGKLLGENYSAEKPQELSIEQLKQFKTELKLHLTLKDHLEKGDK